MRRSWLALAIVVALLLGTAAPARAIVYGEVDEDNVFNYVGAFIVDIPDFGLFQICSGTLISSTVFLTAAHCTDIAIEEGWDAYVFFGVEFDADTVKRKQLHPGTMHQHPGFPGTSADPFDVAVIVLDRAVSGIQPASLPTRGLLDQLAMRNGLKGQKFLAVGYGVVEPQIGPGGVTFFGAGTRRFAHSEFHSLNSAWLRLSQNDATDDGGTCFGDSGGPNFLGDSKTIAAITVTGDAICIATNDTYRMDIDSVRQFLSTFVTVP